MPASNRRTRPVSQAPKKAVDPALRKALRQLCKADCDMARAVKIVADLPDRRREAGFATLMKIIVEQQLSVASANAIWGRVHEAALPFTPEAFLRLTTPKLRRCGLSAGKILYCRELARALVDGTLDLEAVHGMDDQAAIAELVKVKGIGRWTAEIYLLFALDRPDIWPAHDLALQVALQHVKQLEKRPTARMMDELAEAWRPHRAVAARVLWRYYGLQREAAKAKPAKPVGRA